MGSTPKPPPDETAAQPPAAPPREEFPLEQLDASTRETIERIAPYSMTGPARTAALIDAVRYCVARGVPGDFAECGVWRGGSVLAMILTLQELGVDDREIHLYDTFEGMTAPTAADTSRFDQPASEAWEQTGGRPWEMLFDGETNSERAVRELLHGTGYPPERIHLVAGPVEETVPAAAPEQLALLRLDTDWYESTLHELRHLYPRLSEGGVLIIDDYGHWDGCRRAVDEYFAQEASPPLLSRIDYTGRLAVKW